LCILLAESQQPPPRELPHDALGNFSIRKLAISKEDTAGGGGERQFQVLNIMPVQISAIALVLDIA
jgi:hypothetical protein